MKWCVYQGKKGRQGGYRSLIRLGCYPTEAEALQHAKELRSAARARRDSVGRTWVSREDS